MAVISKKTVLIVGDQKRMTDAAQEMLTRMHPSYGHVCVSSFAEARNLMNEMDNEGLDPFSLVITSANLPIEQGSERTTIAFRFVIKECINRGIDYIVYSSFDRPGSFDGRWVTFNPKEHKIHGMKDLNTEFRFSQGMW